VHVAADEVDVANAVLVGVAEDGYAKWSFKHLRTFSTIEPMLLKTSLRTSTRTEGNNLGHISKLELRPRLDRESYHCSMYTR
jgi:hypothetical protein